MQDEPLIAVQAANTRLIAVLKDALSPGVFGAWHTVHDPLVAQTDIREICERCGYGAVMSFVSHLWAEKAKASGLSGSEHTVAAAGAVRRDWIKKARRAIRDAQPCCAKKET